MENNQKTIKINEQTGVTVKGDTIVIQQDIWSGKDTRNIYLSTNEIIDLAEKLKTEKEFSNMIKNSMYAMVDMFLNHAFTESEIQKENIAEFIIDCHNLEEYEQEYKLLKQKFIEEFENNSVFYKMDNNYIYGDLSSAIYELIEDREIPLLIVHALNESEIYS